MTLEVPMEKDFLLYVINAAFWSHLGTKNLWPSSKWMVTVAWLRKLVNGGSTPTSMVVGSTLCSDRIATMKLRTDA